MIILVILLLFIGTLTSECPPGTQFICQMNSCLAVIQNGTKHGAFQATVDCRSMDGNLTPIHSHLENSIVFAFLLNDTVDGNAYIGGIRKNGQWTWADGSVMNYTNWAGGEPTGGDDCIQMSRRQGKWITADCSERNVSYFCSIPYEAPSSSTTTTTTPKTTTTTAASPACPLEWTLFNGNCYFLKESRSSGFLFWFEMSTEYTWKEARSYCLGAGGNLASIHSSEENRFLTTLSTENNGEFPWIGLQWNNGYSWSDGSSVSFNNATREKLTRPVGYFLYPSAFNVTQAGEWMAARMTGALYSFICKRKPTSSTLFP